MNDLIAPHPTPDVSIVTVNWNTRELLRRAIESAERWAGGLRIERIVVDNASADGSAEMVRRDFPDVRLIANDDNAGYTKACNQGIAVAGGRYVLFLNSDAELTEGCLPELVRVMEAHPEVGACSPRLTADRAAVPGGVFPRLWLRLLPVSLNWRIENRMIQRFYRDAEIYDVEWLVGACLMVRRAVIEQVGGMEERLFMWYDDADWCLRMKKAGWRRVVVPGALCRHEHGASAQQVPSLQADFRMTMAEYSYWRLHKGRALTAILYWTRVVRLWVNRVRLAGMGRLRPGEGVRQRLEMATARLRWHLSHRKRIMDQEPYPYRGE